MENFDTSFKPNYDDAKSDKKAIIGGAKYRITVLSEILVRLEYNENGVFEDRPTELALFRNFPVPKFELQENDKYIVIKTDYFSLQYIKDKPFTGSTFAPDTNLRIALNDTDKGWYYGHDEARNFQGFANNLESKEVYKTQAEKQLEEPTKKILKDKIFKLKGLYSTDGFCAIDDSKSLILNALSLLT